MGSRQGRLGMVVWTNETTHGSPNLRCLSSQTPVEAQPDLQSHVL